MLRDESVRVEETWCGIESEVAREDKCEQLHRRLKRIVKARGALDAQEAEALREADRLRLWRHYGYASLLDYMEIEMGYTPRVALERFRVAKAIVELPAIADAMAQGDLSFSAGRELTRVATPETEQEWLEAVGDKNVRDIEDMVSGHQRGEKPTDPVDPKLRTRAHRFDDIDEETRVMLRQARQILERECGDRMSDRDFLRTFARMVIDGAATPSRTGPPYVIAVTICERCKRGWQDGGGLTVEMSPATVDMALCDALHIGSIAETTSCTANSRAHGDHASDQASADTSARPLNVKRDEKTKSPLHAKREQKTKRARSTIPPALRRKVKHRDHGRCRVPGCRSSRNVDQHHLQPIALGGKHDEENIISLCESHHLAHHSGALLIEGAASSAVFTRRAHSAFAIAERTIETASALKQLGFDKHDVKAAMDKTRTHVGTTELTIEQWIKIALGYCPKPR
jgi:5-methylcytosine-specific restriction endonuclease McrA